MSARGWIIAVAGSIAAHALTLGALALSLEPEPPPEQASPGSRLSIEAQQVVRTQAASVPAPTQSVDETAAAPTVAAQGVVRQTVAAPAAPASATLKTAALSAPRAKAPPPAGRRLEEAQAPQASPDVALDQIVVVAALPDSAQALAATPERTARVIATALPAATAASARQPTAPSLAAARMPSVVAPPVATPEIATPAAAPEADRVAPSQAEADRVAPSQAEADRVAPAQAEAERPAALRPAGQPAQQAQPDPTAAADLPLPAIKGTAELAWSGQGDTTVNATSLAAIAAFTREGDLASSAQQVRDGIAGILASVPCARLQTTFIPETGALELRGHIPEDALRAPVLAALRAQVGDAIPLSDELLILPRPQCGALAGIADVGLPQSTEQITNPAVIGTDGFAQNYTYVDGQRLHLDLVAPDYDSFVYVDYFVADGSVIHLQPNAIVPLEFTTAKSPLSVGRERGDKPSLDLTIGAPYGQEIAAAFAASVPLYEGLRPLQEPAEPYLAYLKERVRDLRDSNPEFKGEWVYFFVSTRPE